MSHYAIPMLRLLTLLLNPLKGYSIAEVVLFSLFSPILPFFIVHFTCCCTTI
jgi:hypothetical protein